MRIGVLLMSIIARTDNAVIVDCQAAFSQNLHPCHSKQWLLKSADFDVHEPYFRASQHPSKKRKATAPSNPADVDTEKRHQDVRSFLLTCIKEAEKVWPTVKNEASQVDESPPCKTEDDPIDFTSLVSVAQAAARFAVHNDTMELNEGKQKTGLKRLD